MAFWYPILIAILMLRTEARFVLESTRHRWILVALDQVSPSPLPCPFSPPLSHLSLVPSPPSFPSLCVSINNYSEKKFLPMKIFASWAHCSQSWYYIFLRFLSNQDAPGIQNQNLLSSWQVHISAHRNPKFDITVSCVRVISPQHTLSCKNLGSFIPILT